MHGRSRVDGEGPAQTANYHQPGFLPGRTGGSVRRELGGPHRGGSQVRSQEKHMTESAPVMTLPPSPLETSRKSGAQFVSQVEVATRDNTLCLWPSCHPIDVAENGPTGTPPPSQAPSIPFLLLDAKRLLVCHSEWRLARTVHCFTTMWH